MWSVINKCSMGTAQLDKIIAIPFPKMMEKIKMASKWHQNVILTY